MINFILSIVIIFVCGFCGYAVGLADSSTEYQAKCVAKYSDMPYNKVQAHCKELLEFK